MEPNRFKLVHNFSLPCLKWGTQRLLKCVSNNINNNNNDPLPSINPNSSQNDEFVDVDRERIMGDLFSIFEGNGVVGNDGVVVDGSNGDNRPWNWRTRRDVCKAPPPPSPPIPPVRDDDDGRRFIHVGSSTPSSPMVMKNNKMVMVNAKLKFSVSLPKEEVEEDFWALGGTRPQKRPKIVQMKKECEERHDIEMILKDIEIQLQQERKMREEITAKFEESQRKLEEKMEKQVEGKMRTMLRQMQNFSGGQSSSALDIESESNHKVNNMTPHKLLSKSASTT